MLISGENYAQLHMWGDHEGHAYNEYILISGMLITGVVYARLPTTQTICVVCSMLHTPTVDLELAE